MLQRLKNRILQLDFVQSALRAADWNGRTRGAAEERLIRESIPVERNWLDYGLVPITDQVKVVRVPDTATKVEARYDGKRIDTVEYWAADEKKRRKLLGLTKKPTRKKRTPR